MKLICEMELQQFIKGKTRPMYQKSTVYFQSKTYTNIEETNEYDIISHMIEEIMEKINNYQNNGQVGISKKLSV